MGHPFFKGIDWENLFTIEAPPRKIPFKAKKEAAVLECDAMFQPLIVSPVNLVNNAKESVIF
jgi:hypothetical protein